MRNRTSKNEIPTWEKLSHSDETGRTRELKAIRGPARDGEDVGEEPGPSELRGELLAHPPQFDGPFHCANHVVRDDCVRHHLRVDLFEDILLQGDVLRLRELPRWVLPEPS